MTSEFSDMISIEVIEHGRDARLITVVGEIDTLTAPQLATVLTEQLAAARLVVVDLDDVQFMSSAGLSVLFEAHERANSQDRLLRLVCHSRIVLRALVTTGLDQHFSFADTVSKAVQDSP